MGKYIIVGVQGFVENLKLCFIDVSTIEGLFAQRMISGTARINS
jgi:hypothetical protein